MRLGFDGDRWLITRFCLYGFLKVAWPARPAAAPPSPLRWPG
jgi:hypothetical protein